MKIALRAREMTRSLGGFLEDEFDGIAAVVGAAWDKEHNADTAGHTNITLRSLTSNQPDEMVRVQSGLRYLSGPWLIDNPGNSDNFTYLTPPQITGNQNNYAPAGINYAVGLAVESDANRDITGIQVAERSVRLLLFTNKGNFNITLKHNNAGSNAQNRFGLVGGADVVVASAQEKLLRYDIGSEVWRVVG